MLNKKLLIYVAGVLLGAVLGYLYYYYIGCRSGSCPLRSNPFYNIVLGSLIGYLIIDVLYGFFFQKKKSKKFDKE